MDLDPVREEFVADTGQFVAGIELAIEAAKNFAEAVHADIRALAEFQAALDSLPLEKTVTLRFNTEGAPGAVAGGAAGAAALAAETDAMRAAEEAAYSDAAAQEAAAAAMAQAGGAASFETMALRELRDMSASLDLVAATLGESQQNLAVIQRDTADSSADLMMQTALLRDAQNTAGASIVRVDNSTRNYNRTLVSSAGAARNAGRLWGVLPLTWNAIHLAITGTAEALAVIIPAMVAAGAAAAVGFQGAVDVGQRMNAVYTTTEATMRYLGATVSTATGQGLDSFTAAAGQAADAGQRLHDNLQKAQDAAQPRVYELLGAAIDGANGKFDVFNQIGSQTITMLDAFGAKLDVELAGPMGNFATELTSHAVPDLQQLGQVFGNVGHAVASAASAMPGMAEVLLRVLDAGSQVLVWAMHFQTAMEGLLLAHEAQMWGGLLSNAIGRVSGALATGVVNLGAWAAKAVPFEAAATGVEDAALAAGTALKSTSVLMGGVWGTAIAGAAIALGFLIADLRHSKDATEQWISSLETTVAQASGLQQIAATGSALHQVTVANAAAQRQAAEATRQYAAAAATAATTGSRFDDTVAASAAHAGALRTVMEGAATDANALSGAQKQLTADWNTELSNVRLLSSEYRIGYTEAAELAGDAGVSLTQTLKGNSVAAQQARQMITNLIAGYGGMASVGSELGQDINAVSFAAEIQNGNITKLNQAWDTFISTVQAPSSTFLAFGQSLVQFGQDAQQSGASMSGLGGSIVKSSHNISNASLQLQQDFNSSVTSAEQMLDSMRTVAAITGNGGQLVAGIKDTVAALIPMAGTNEAARAQLFALAQEAGGPASGSMQSLAKWAGNTKDPLGNLYSLSMKAAGAIQNLGADTQALAATMQSTLNQTLVTQAQALTGVDTKTATYLKDLQTLGPNSLVTQAALDQLNNSISQSNTLATNAGGSISALSGKVTGQGNAAAAQAANRAQLNTDIQRITDKAPGAATDINNLATAIRNTGSASAAGGAREAIIRDLEAMHINAQTATAWVDQLISALENIPNIRRNVVIQYSTTGSVQAAVQGGGHLTGPGQIAAAAGMRLPGYGGGDIVPAMLEPGEAVVPKHLVGYIAPFLAAHHVPGFAAGGMADVHGGGHGGPSHAALNMRDVEAIWASEIVARDLRGHTRGHPLAAAAMELLLRSAAQPKHLSGLWKDPVYRGLEGLIRHDLGPYAARDLQYWRLLADQKALHHSEAVAVAHDLHEIHLHERSHQPGWVRFYERQLHGLEHADALKFALWASELSKLRREGFSAGGLVRSYDSGGYLPVGLSMAYNGTGRPEPVGGGGHTEVHVHLHGDLADDSIWERMQVKTLDYGYQNTGRPTGVWQPGG